MRLNDLTELGRRIVDDLVGAKLAWRRPGQLASSLGLATDDVLDALADLEGQGWIVAWEEWPEGTSVTFTPLAAEVLQIRIVEEGPKETPRWARAEAPDPSPPKAKRVFRDFAVMTLVIDPSPSPPEAFEIGQDLAGLQIATRKESKPPRRGSWQASRQAAKRAQSARERREANRRKGA